MSYQKKFDSSTGLPEKNKIMGGTLYLVATPIGNLSDMSERAIKVLSEVDFVAAEDTRNTGMLLNHLGIEKKPMISYFEHNKRQRGEVILERLLSGESGALVSDAGTPAISDPGEDIVALCAENGVTVTSVPGACAGITALILSGLPTSRFSFEGFLSGSKNERRKRLDELKDRENTMIIYEAPHKLCKTLDDIYAVFGNRRISLCRELTKLNEDIMRTTLEGAIEHYKNHDPRGEYVLVIEGCSSPRRSGDTQDTAGMSAVEMVMKLVDEGASKNDAIKQVAKELGVPKSQIYKEVVEAKNTQK